MTTFVDTSVLLTGPHESADHDPVVVVVRSAQPVFREILGEAAALEFETLFGTKYSENDFGGIFDVLVEKSEIIFSKLAAEKSEETANRIGKTAEGFLQVVLSVLSKLDSIEEVEVRVDRFIEAMAKKNSDAEAVSQVKFRLLVTLFNIFSPSTLLRLRVARALCAFEDFGVFDLVSDCDKWIANFDWDLAPVEIAGLYADVAKVAKDPADKLKFWLLQARAQPDLAADSIVARVLSMPSFVDIVELETLKLEDVQLKKTLEILARASFEEIHQLKGDAILEEKLRILALGNLAVKGTISVATVASKLETNQPLDLIIKAMELGVLEGAINEVDGLVKVSAIRPRTRAEIRKIQDNLKSQL